MVIAMVVSGIHNKENMITPEGYSKDPNIQPDGIVLTFPVAFFKDRGMTCAEFEKLFTRYMRTEDAVWNFRLTNLPTRQVQYVYLIFDGFLQFRATLIEYQRNVAKEFNDSEDGQIRRFPVSNWVLFTGPLVKCPFNRMMRGFQGFRYCTELF